MSCSGYPVVLNLCGRRCVVVGGGHVAERKLKGLVRHSCSETTLVVISPAVTPEIRRLERDHELTVIPRRFTDNDLAGAFLVFAATDERDTNARVAKRCMELGVLVNVADVPEQGSFRVPAVALSGELQIAVSTGGAGPALAAEIARELEKKYEGFGEYVALLRWFRSEAQARIADTGSRSVLLRAAAAPQMRELVRSGSIEAVRLRLDELLKTALETKQDDV